MPREAYPLEFFTSRATTEDDEEGVGLEKAAWVLEVEGIDGEVPAP